MRTTGLGAHVLLGALAVAVSAAAAPDRPRPTVAFTFQDPVIEESSGLLDLGDHVATVNDSGDGPVVYLVDRDTGETVGRTTYTSDDVVDVEALAAGPRGEVWVGDIGDNDAIRPTVTVYAVPRPTPGDRAVDARSYLLGYPDGPHDAEALLVHPRTGRLLVVTKGLFGGQVFAAPTTLDPERVNRLELQGSVDGMVTDGAFLPDGHHVLLRTYSSASLYDTRDWTSLASLALPQQEQGEGLAVSQDERLLVSTEGSGTEVVSVPLSAKMRAALEPRPSAGPASNDPALSARDADDRDWLLVGGGAAGVLGAALLGAVLLRRRGQSRSTT